MRRYEKRKIDRMQRMERYSKSDLNGKLIINFLDISHTMRLLYEGKDSQKRILIVLGEVGSITQRELTERLGIKPGSVSEVLAKLENAGLIERTSSTQDRRTVDISLTEEGKKQAAAASARRRQRHEQMFSCLTADEKTTLLTLLEKVNDDWESRYQDIEQKTGETARHYSRIEPAEQED